MQTKNRILYTKAKRENQNPCHTKSNTSAKSVPNFTPGNQSRYYKT